MTIKAIFAADRWGGMGFEGTMPWPHNSADLKNFKELTTGHVVVMGRKTWEDQNLPKPLPNRTVYVATSLISVPHATPIRGDLKAKLLSLEAKHPDKTIWVIGGPNILEQCVDVLDSINLTHYYGNYRTDTKLNLKNFLSAWTIKRASADPDQPFTVVEYEPLFKRAM